MEVVQDEEERLPLGSVFEAGGQAVEEAEALLGCLKGWGRWKVGESLAINASCSTAAAGATYSWDPGDGRPVKTGGAQMTDTYTRSGRFSVSHCATTRPRLAPSAKRMAVSRRRAVVRARSRFDTLAQAISSTRPTAPKSVRSGCPATAVAQ